MRATHAIVGVGIDVVEVDDMHKARFKKRVAEYFLTKQELQHLPAGAGLSQYLASRFALKEAVIKAFPGTLTPFDFRIEKKGGRPCVVFSEPQRNKIYQVSASLTHTAHIAAAIAIVHSV